MPQWRSPCAACVPDAPLLALVWASVTNPTIRGRDQFTVRYCHAYSMREFKVANERRGFKGVLGQLLLYEIRYVFQNDFRQYLFDKAMVMSVLAVSCVSQWRMSSDGRSTDHKMPNDFNASVGVTFAE